MGGKKERMAKHKRAIFVKKRRGGGEKNSIRG
jgi:hypothetical protein